MASVSVRFSNILIRSLARLGVACGVPLPVAALAAVRGLTGLAGRGNLPARLAILSVERLAFDRCVGRVLPLSPRER